MGPIFLWFLDTRWCLLNIWKQALKAYVVRTTHPCPVSCTQWAQKVTSGVEREKSLLVVFRKIQKKTEYLGCGIKRATVLAKPLLEQCSRAATASWEYCGHTAPLALESWVLEALLPDSLSAASLKKRFLLLSHHIIHRNVVYLRSVELQFILAVSKSGTHLKHPYVGAWPENNEKIATQTKKNLPAPSSWCTKMKTAGKKHCSWGMIMKHASIKLCIVLTPLYQACSRWTQPKNCSCSVVLKLWLVLPRKSKIFIECRVYLGLKILPCRTASNWRKIINTLIPFHLMEPKHLQGPVWYLWHLAERWCKQMLRWRWGNFKRNVSLIATPWQSHWKCSPFYKKPYPKLFENFTYPSKDSCPETVIRIPIFGQDLHILSSAKTQNLNN